MRVLPLLILLASAAFAADAPTPDLDARKELILARLRAIDTRDSAARRIAALEEKIPALAGPKLDEANTELGKLTAAHKTAVAEIQRLDKKLKQPLAAAKPAEPPPPFAPPPTVEVPVKTLELQNGTAINARRLLLADDNGKKTYRVTLLNGSIRVLDGDDVALVKDNHDFFKQYKERPARAAEAKAYRDLLAEKTRLDAECARAAARASEFQETFAKLKEQRDKAPTPQVLDDYVENRKNLEILTAQFEAAKKNAAAFQLRIDAFKELQIYFALVEKRNPAKAMDDLENFKLPAKPSDSSSAAATQPDWSAGIKQPDPPPVPPRTSTTPREPEVAALPADKKIEDSQQPRAIDPQPSTDPARSDSADPAPKNRPREPLAPDTLSPANTEPSTATQPSVAAPPSATTDAQPASNPAAPLKPPDPLAAAHNQQTLIVLLSAALALALIAAAFFAIRSAKSSRLARQSQSDLFNADRFNCPECGESIPLAARSCRFCHAILSEKDKPSDAT